MRYTPVELRHARPSRSLLGGYKRDDVDRLLEDVVDSFEEVWRERGELADKLEDIEQLLAEVKQREALLASTLVAAEKTAAGQIEAAKREGEVIIAEANQEARSITRTALSERDRLFAASRRVETLLRTALGMVEEVQHEPRELPAPEYWPNRQDTREFRAIETAEAAPAPSSEAEALPEPEPTQLPPVQEVPAPSAADDDSEEGRSTARDFAWG